MSARSPRPTRVGGSWRPGADCIGHDGAVPAPHPGAAGTAGLRLRAPAALPVLAAPVVCAVVLAGLLARPGEGRDSDLPDRERLTARLLAEQEQLRESRTRLVEAGDRERRRLARDLHDRLQSRLVLLALRAGTARAEEADLEAFRRDVDEVAAEAGLTPSEAVARRSRSSAVIFGETSRRSRTLPSTCTIAVTESSTSSVGSALRQPCSATDGG